MSIEVASGRTTDPSGGADDRSSREQVVATIMGHPVLCPKPFEHQLPDKGEDRILFGLLAERWPFVIVADGVSDSEGNGGDIVSGFGGNAAQAVAETAKKHLDSTLRRKHLHEILIHVREAYDQGAEELKTQKTLGKTTLLVAFLCEIGEPASPKAFWVYAYEGDGSIVLMSPQRKIDGKIWRTELLAPGQKYESTASISQGGPSVAPVVGCVAYEPGDMIYLASDGMDAVQKAVRQNKKVFFANYIWDCFEKTHETTQLYSELSNFRYDDDAVLGLIWTRK